MHFDTVAVEREESQAQARELKDEQKEQVLKLLLAHQGKNIRFRIGSRWHYVTVLAVNEFNRKVKYSEHGQPDAWMDIDTAEEYLA